MCNTLAIIQMIPLTYISANFNVLSAPQSPEAQKARLKEKGEEFEKQMKKKTTALKPRLIGCVWRDDSNTDPSTHRREENL